MEGFQSHNAVAVNTFSVGKVVTYSMLYKGGLEQIEPGKWQLWIFGLPGCFSRATSPEKAVERSRRAIADYFNWRDGYQRVTDDAADLIKVEVSERFENYETLDGNWVNSFFKHDRRPLTGADVDDVRWLLSCTRSGLMAATRRAPSNKLNEPIEGERFGSLAGILNHVAVSEWWLWDRLGLSFPREQMDQDPFAALAQVRRHTTVRLSKLIDNDKNCEIGGEMWSARKVARRMLWHERVHAWHIRRLAALL